MKKCILIFLVFPLFTLCNCGEDESPKPLHVYVAGNQYINNDNAPVYWKDGEMIELPYDVDYAEATDIFVSGGDVYVAGSTFNYTTQKSRALYWKNSETIFLTTEDSFALLYGIFVSGKDVYAVGVERIGGINVASYWKNGAATRVTNGANHSFGHAIFVKGNDVYVGGREFNIATGQYVAKVWKNGTATNLTADDRSGYISSVFVSDNDVYVSGREENPRKGVYWKNGVRTELSQNGWVSSVVADEGIVYASITETVSGGLKPAYQKGTEETLLAEFGEAWDIAVFEKKSYVAGNTYTNGTNIYQAKIWIDGVEETLSVAGTSSYATGVFVTRH